jgi:predicted GIY-YIG superfamily endonuclease
MKTYWNTEKFIVESKNSHLIKYDYSKVKYTNINNSVIIICPVHGEFNQNAYHHLKGGDCKLCSYVKINKKKSKWTLEKCRELVKNFTTIKEWQKKSNGSYKAAKRNGWFNEISNHIIYIRNPISPWNLENCRNEALKYSSRTEWYKKSSASYSRANKMGWLDECSSHMKLLGNYSRRQIYCYKFKDKTVYVGLTYNINLRKKLHASNEKSPVLKYMKKSRLNPKFVVLTDLIDINEVKKMEQYYIDFFKEKKWNVLNKAKAGGLGGRIIKWSKDNCIADALKYSSASDWENNSGSAYNISLRKGWIKECSLHFNRKKRDRNYWNKEKCVEIVLNSKNMNELKIKYSGAYNAIVKNGWYSYCKSLFK